MAPDLALQTAIRSVLVPALAELVPADRIRAGNIRGELMPCIVMGTPRVAILGRGANGHAAARLDLMLHVWADRDDTETAQRIAGAVLAALLDAPRAPDLWCDEWERPVLAWSPDPAGTHVHGAVSLSCVARWRQ